MIKAFRELVDITIVEANSLGPAFNPQKSRELFLRLVVPYEQMLKEHRLQRAQLEIALEALKYYADGTSAVARVALQDIEYLRNPGLRTS
jgi:hypothetical protein